MLPKQFILFFITVFGLQAYPTASNKPEFSYKVYGNIANYFSDEKMLLDFFEFKKGGVVAEIGANDGQNAGGLSLLTDSLTFYVQDINAKALNQKSFDKIIRKCSKYKSPLTNKFMLCIGTEKATNLPDNAFDKIIIVSAFHEFVYMDEMIRDISKKLKAGGKLYILETHCFEETHRNYTIQQTTEVLKKYGLYLVKSDEQCFNGGVGTYKAAFEK